MSEQNAAVPRRTRAHTAAQLREALGWTTDQWERALAAGLIPDQDMKTPRWSGRLVGELVAARDELLAQLPDDADADEMMRLLGVEYGAWRRGLEAGVIPGPDRGAYWTRPLAEDVAARAQEIRAQIPPQPLGARRCAELLAELTGLEVTDDDVEALADRGLTSIVDWYKKWPLYDVGALHLVAADDGKRTVLEEVVAERQAWLAGSLPPAEAAAHLGWEEHDLARVGRQRGISPGRYGRYAQGDIAVLAADEDLVDEVRRAQLLTPRQAAAHMEIRRSDFDHLRSFGWVQPADWFTWKIRRGREVDVPLYSVGSLEDALDMPGVDWEAVRAVKPGEPSPLREYAHLARRR